MNGKLLTEVENFVDNINNKLKTEFYYEKNKRTLNQALAFILTNGKRTDNRFSGTLDLDPETTKSKIKESIGFDIDFNF